MQTVTSKDGTKIAYETIGQGPKIVLVSGATASRSSWEKMANLLAPNFTVYAYDRRGRGDSGDTLPYAVEREVEDIEALIDAAGGSAFVYGISSGGALVLEAVMSLGDKIKKAAVYEVPYDSSEEGARRFNEYRTNLKELLAEGRKGDAAALFMKLVGMPDEMLAGMRQGPMWPYMEAIAPTIAYDADVMGEGSKVPTERLAAVTTQMLVMDGEASLQLMPFMRTSAEVIARAIPNSQRMTLEGQGHDVDSKVLAPVLQEFFGSSV